MKKVITSIPAADLANSIKLIAEYYNLTGDPDAWDFLNDFQAWLLQTMPKFGDRLKKWPFLDFEKPADWDKGV